MDAIQARLATKAAWVAEIARFRAGEPMQGIDELVSDPLPDDPAYLATVTQLDAEIAELRDELAADITGASGATDTPPATLAEAVAARCSAVDAIFAAKTISKSAMCVCSTPSGVLQCDSDSRLNISGACLMAVLAMQTQQPFSINWTLADNTSVALDASHMVAVGQAVGGYVAHCHYHAQAIKAQIRASADIAGANAIDLGAGWP